MRSRTRISQRLLGAAQLVLRAMALQRVSQARRERLAQREQLAVDRQLRPAGELDGTPTTSPAERSGMPTAERRPAATAAAPRQG